MLMEIEGLVMYELEPPPGAENPLADLEWIKRGIWTIYRQNLQLLEASMNRYFSVKDLAGRFGCTPQTLYKSPWRLPNFGKADITGPDRWRGSTCDMWYARPEADRRREWEEAGSEERRRKMGRTA
jgi:hypothetical protein